MDWISKPVALWDWDNPLPPPSTAVTVAAVAGDDLSGDPPSSVDGSSVVDAPRPPAPAPAAASAVATPQLGLGLGKRTYFEGEKKGEKKPHVQSTRCQVEGCGADLSSAKDYHRKHRVCEGHSKCPRVIVAGQERRFCQQCSRFHALSEFDQKKRSCRRRLTDHNARRRKPQPDSFSFGSTRLSSSFCDERKQISFMWNKAPFGILRQTPWAESDFKISNSKGFQIKPGNPDPNLLNPFPSIGAERLLSIKGSPIQVLNQGSEARGRINNNNTRGISDLDGAPDNNLRRALSLLSSSQSPMQNSNNTPGPPSSPAWHDQPPGPTSLFQFNSSSSPSPPPPAQTVTLAGNSAYWFDEEPSTSFSVQNGNAATGSLHFQEFQLLKPAVQYETAAFFDSSQIH